MVSLDLLLERRFMLHPSSVRIEASYRISRALCNSSREGAPYHKDVTCLVAPLEEPAIFWRKWFRTPGLRATGTHIAPIHLENVAGMSVVFIDRIVSPNSYLLDGIALARSFNAGMMIVITHRFLFTDDDHENRASSKHETR